MKKFMLLAAVMLNFMAVSILAQKPVITFNEKEHDFGNINEKDGVATHIFEFKNTGDAPLIIQNVQASCGCTTPEWTKTPIEPGKKGNITVSYNPTGRPNGFVKQIYVSSNATNERETLVIKGNVISASSPVSAYPLQIGDLKLKSKTIFFPNLEKGSTQTQNIAIQNAGPTNMSVSLNDVPNFIDVKVTPQTLKPNEEGVISLTFDSKKCMEWGPITDNAYLVINGRKDGSELYKISISGNILDNFSKMSASEKRQAPIVEIKSPNLFFGNIKMGTKVRGKVLIKNVGTNPLEIRRIVNNNSDLSIHPMRATVKGGKTETLKIEIDSKYLPKGDYKKVFVVQTNDPVNSFLTYVVNFSVK